MGEDIDKEAECKWAVIQAEVYSPEEGCASGICGGFSVFNTKEEAIEYIERVIRDEWTTTVTIPTDEDEFHEEQLADHKGYQSDRSSVKWSDVYYSEEGDLAWCQVGDTSKRIEAVPMKGNGERTWMTC